MYISNGLTACRQRPASLFIWTSDHSPSGYTCSWSASQSMVFSCQSPKICSICFCTWCRLQENWRLLWEDNRITRLHHGNEYVPSFYINNASKVHPVLNPKEKMAYFKKNWSKELQGDVLKCVEEVVCQIFLLSIARITCYSSRRGIFNWTRMLTSRNPHNQRLQRRVCTYCSVNLVMMKISSPTTTVWPRRIVTTHGYSTL